MRTAKSERRYLMNIKVKKTVEVIIESINFIIITYALSGMAMSFRTNPVYI